MINRFAEVGCSIADRLILLDALNSHYEILFASDGSDVSEVPSVIPSAMIWIHDRDRAVVVIAIQQLDEAAKYDTLVLIRPYTRHADGSRVLCDPLPEDHPRCSTAAKEAAMALSIHVEERRLGGASAEPKEARTVDYSEVMPQRGDIRLFLEVRDHVSGIQNKAEFHQGFDRNIWVRVTPEEPDPDDAKD
jgi:hypothetical protein